MQSLYTFVCVLCILYIISRSSCIGCSSSILIPCERWNENINIVYCLLSIVYCLLSIDSLWTVHFLYNIIGGKCSVVLYLKNRKYGGVSSECAFLTIMVELFAG